MALSRPGKAFWVALVVASSLGAAGIGAAAWMRAPHTEPADGGPAPGKRLAELQKRFLEISKRDGDTAGIRRNVAAFVDRHPGHAGGHKLLGQIWLRAGKRGRAYRRLARSLELEPDQPETALLAGSIAYGRRNYETAARHYRTAVSHAKRNARAWQHLARAKLRLGDLAAAEASLNRALSLDSSAWKAYVTLAKVAERRSRPGRAVRRLRQALERLPVSEEDKRLELITRQARLLRADGRPSEALQVLESAPATARGELRLLSAVARSWAALGRPARAAERYERAFAESPERPELLVRAAKWRARAGDRDRARSHLSAARGLAPDLEIPDAVSRLLRKNGAGS